MGRGGWKKDFEGNPAWLRCINLPYLRPTKASHGIEYRGAALSLALPLLPRLGLIFSLADPDRVKFILKKEKKEKESGSRPGMSAGSIFSLLLQAEVFYTDTRLLSVSVTYVWIVCGVRGAYELFQRAFENSTSPTHQLQKQKLLLVCWASRGSSSPAVS